jgi:hypothetical protein
LNGKTSPDQPCSLNTLNHFNLQHPAEAYLVLEAGISSTSDNFGNTNFTQALRSQSSSTSSGDQVVTYLDPVSGQNHSMLFYLDAAAQFSFDGVANYGYDYNAPTHSMQTSCKPADHLCQLKFNSTEYDCSPIFSGNFSQDSNDGLFRIPNWNTTFYAINTATGTPHEITTTDAQNPFTFNVTGQVDSVSDIVSNFNTSETQLSPPLIITSPGNVAFALTCTGWVYNVNYSLINGSISNFEKSLASPALASIVRAPLQVGYGRYNLYQAAMLGVLSFVTNLVSDQPAEPINSTIARSFSQVGIALSAGAFNYTVNNVQHERYDMVFTRVPKAPVWFLAVVCFVFALMSVVLFGLALYVRKQDGVKELQKSLGVGDASGVIAQQFKANGQMARKMYQDLDEADT